MASNVIELIKVLRDRTGAGMMDCKKALMETDCDVEKAVEWLREKGIAKVAKKASRIAAEGLTHVVVNGNEALILEINSSSNVSTTITVAVILLVSYFPITKDDLDAIIVIVVLPNSLAVRLLFVYETTVESLILYSTSCNGLATLPSFAFT